MYQDLDDELFLAPESTVSLLFDTRSDEEGEVWGMDRSDALTQAESAAWVRHSAHGSGFSDALAGDGGDDDRPRTLRDAMRLVMELP